MADLKYLSLSDGERIAYCHTPGKGPGVLFCSGFNSDLRGIKAQALEAWCIAEGRQYTRFDYYAHGASSGDWAQGCIGRWRDDTLRVLDEICTGPQVVVGSSMGGWLMLLAALARPEKIRALVGLAAAADFTRALYEAGFDDAQRDHMAASGHVDVDNCYDDGEPYRITAKLIEEGQQHLLLDGEIAIDLPVRLIHGQQDPDVPWQNSLAIAEALASDDVEVQLVKNGDHRLSEPQDLERLFNTLAKLLEQIA